MIRTYLQRRKHRVIAVTYTSGATRTYGPIEDAETAEAFLQTRLVPAGTVTPRGRTILSARVQRVRRQPDQPVSELLGVRLILPA